jgi:hypothetical protein
MVHGRLLAEITAVLMAILLLPPLTSAQVYRWEDDGALHFSNSYERIPESQRAQFGPPPPVSVETADPASSTANPASSSAVTRIPYTPGSPILVSASIGGTGSLTLILDTGADRTMVSPGALGRLGIPVGDGLPARIKGVTGTAEGSMVQVASVEVGQAKVGPLRILVHDAELKADGLLGRDFLEHFTVTIDSKERQVTLAPK